MTEKYSQDDGWTEVIVALPGETADSLTVQEEGQHVYICKATDEWGNTAEVEMWVRVEGPEDEQYDSVQSTLPDPYILYVPFGGTVTLTGQFVESPLLNGASYQWCYRELTSDDFMTEIEGASSSSYTIKNIKKSGEYTLDVTSRFGYTSTQRFRVIVNGFELQHKNVDNKRVDVFVNTGEDAVLSVSVKADDVSKVHYQWYLVTDEEGKKEIFGATAAELIIPAADIARDDAYYFCRVYDDFGNEDSEGFNIYVGLSLAFQHLYFLREEGQDVILKVDGLQSFGQPVYYQWYHEIEAYDHDGDPVVKCEGETTSTLYVKNADIHNELDLFYCVITDDFGNASQVQKCV